MDHKGFARIESLVIAASRCRTLLVAVLLIAGCEYLPAVPRSAIPGPVSAGSPIRFDQAGLRVLTIVAHPDDELAFAPILGRLCIDLANGCSILVTTFGESGADPAINTQNAKTSARLFKSNLYHWNFGSFDYPGNTEYVGGEWARHAGG